MDGQSTARTGGWRSGRCSCRGSAPSGGGLSAIGLIDVRKATDPRRLVWDYPIVSTTTVHWKWEDEEDDGEGVGPVWVIHPDGSNVDWDEWVRRSIAETYATEHGFEFAPDE